VASNCSMKAGSMKLRRRNHLFSKVVVLMPKVTLIIGKEEMGWTWIAAAANQLVGNYSAMEHNACAMQADAKGDPDYQERGDGGGLGLPRQRTSWLGITARWSITLAPCSFGTVDSIGAAVVISGVKATFLKVDANRDAQASELVPLPRLAGGVCRAEVCGLLFERLREVSFI
jgi:hypothetical protein